MLKMHAIVSLTKPSPSFRLHSFACHYQRAYSSTQRR